MHHVVKRGRDARPQTESTRLWEASVGRVGRKAAQVEPGCGSGVKVRLKLIMNKIHPSLFLVNTDVQHKNM